MENTSPKEYFWHSILKLAPQAHGSGLQRHTSVSLSLFLYHFWLFLCNETAFPKQHATLQRTHVKRGAGMTWPEPREWKWLHFLPLLQTCNYGFSFLTIKAPSLRVWAIAGLKVPQIHDIQCGGVLGTTRELGKHTKKQKSDTHGKPLRVRKVWKSSLEIMTAEHENLFLLQLSI